MYRMSLLFLRIARADRAASNTQIDTHLESGYVLKISKCILFESRLTLPDASFGDKPEGWQRQRMSKKIDVLNMLLSVPCLLSSGRHQGTVRSSNRYSPRSIYNYVVIVTSPVKGLLLGSVVYTFDAHHIRPRSVNKPTRRQAHRIDEVIQSKLAYARSVECLMHGDSWDILVNWYHRRPVCPPFEEIEDHFSGLKLSTISIGVYEPRRFLLMVHRAPQDREHIFRDTELKMAVMMNWGSAVTFLGRKRIMEPPYKIEDIPEVNMVFVSPREAYLISDEAITAYMLDHWPTVMPSIGHRVTSSSLTALILMLSS
ncbi:hypothetical protein EDD18DRAFT_1410250 [Armillaria luteobubalina]|uniref:Uncharacterized protein n=1 Tax=Armillaria luteobubalina TaxID=153913 RepID=A0AA39PXK1_9AGAR|nr:hypothetical protein EDD18DRAFT_1410250 [Armillaria luteobubalina]